MRKVFTILLLAFLPLAAWADGMVVPTIAYPAQVTIPDQRALICFSNNTERLVIETRFTGAGTNFAWVIPFPNPPVIEEATTGLFPTLQYIFRPEIVHDVPGYYLGILLVLGFACGFWRAARSVWHAFLLAILILFAALILLPTLAAGKKKSTSSSSLSDAVSILDRKLVGIFETTTIASREPKALEHWLHENGFLLPTNSEPVIASYVKEGWVFVAAKVRRDDATPDTNTPHPLSFTFKTDRPVYPMRLTGLNNPSLTVGLYVFGNARFTAPRFQVESCTRPYIVHPLLHQWVGTPATATKLTATYLTATLSAADMREDVWLGQLPFLMEQKNRAFSRHGALTTALNWGTGFFAIGLLIIFLWFYVGETRHRKASGLLVKFTLISLAVIGLVYLTLPKIEVKVSRGWPWDWKEKQITLQYDFKDWDQMPASKIRAGFRDMINSPTNAVIRGLKNWDNPFQGGQIHEEDSPGNYLLRETNHQLQFVTFNADGGEEVLEVINLPPEH